MRASLVGLAVFVLFWILVVPLCYGGHGQLPHRQTPLELGPFTFANYALDLQLSAHLYHATKLAYLRRRQRCAGDVRRRAVCLAGGADGHALSARGVDAESCCLSACRRFF
jgi:hypothetical protein